MDQLVWEHGQAPELRKKLAARLVNLSRVDSARVIPLFVGVRFRRVAFDEPNMLNLPPAHRFAIDVAWLDPKHIHLNSVLASRDHTSEIHYEIMRVGVCLPVSLKILKQTQLETAPMLLQPLAPDGKVLAFRQLSGDLATLLVYEPLQQIDFSEPDATEPDTLIELRSQADIQPNWPIRPRRMFTSPGLRRALTLALDSDTSPCRALADLFQLFENGKNLQNPLSLTTYQGMVELALFPQQQQQQQMKITATLGEGKNGQSLYFVDVTNADYETPSPGTKSAAAEYPYSDLKVASQTWTTEESFIFTEPGLVVIPHLTAGVNREAMTTQILNAIATVLKDLRCGKLPSTIDNEACSMLMHSRALLQDRFPPAVLMELQAVIVGGWAWKLFMETDSGWLVRYSARLTTRADEGKYMIQLFDIDMDGRSQKYELTNTDKVQSDGDPFDTTKQLDRALTEYLLPWIGKFGKWHSGQGGKLL